MDTVENEYLKEQNTDMDLNKDAEMNFLKAKKALIRSVVFSFICMILSCAMMEFITQLISGGVGNILPESFGEYHPGLEFIVLGSSAIYIFGILGAIVLSLILIGMEIQVGFYLILAIVTLILINKNKKSASVINWFCIFFYVLCTGLYCLVVGWTSILCIVLSIFNIIVGIRNIIATIKYRKCFKKKN